MTLRRLLITAALAPVNNLESIFLRSRPDQPEIPGYVGRYAPMVLAGMVGARLGRPPVFTGRIVAVHGHFHELHGDLHGELFPALLHHEIASLHIPADPTAPAIMKIKHLGEEEHYLHQADAGRMFLMKTIEVTCGG